MKLLFSLLLAIFLIESSHAQQLLNIQNSPLDTIDCNDQCMYVHANYIKPKLTTQYVVGSIPYAPSNFSSGTIISLQDDKFSAAIPLGFTFCFYGQSYTDVFISANGHITFNSNYASGSCSFDTKKPMPFYNSTYPDNAIFCPFTDGNTQFGGSIKYNILGIAPFRKFVVSYQNIPYFNTACTGTPSTFQCVLYETTNEIECFIENKTTCNADTSNYLNFSTLGIQSLGANNFLTVPNRNASIWSATNEGWRFSPSGANAYSIKWFTPGNFLLASNVDSINVCSPFPRTVIAKVDYSCPATTVSDTITIVKLSPKFDSIKITPSLCKNLPSGTIKVYGTGYYPPLTYSLNSSAFTSNNIFNNVPYGANVITIKDANGCKKDTVVNVTAISTLTAHIDSFKNPTCPIHNGTIWGSVSGGTPPYSYTWGTTFQTGLGPGTYYFTVMDANGCKDSIGVSLVYDSLPNALAVITKPVCQNASGSIDITPYGGTGPYTYLWNTNATTQDISNVPSGAYNVLITDANGCTKVRYFALNDTLNMQIDIVSVQHTKCGLNNGTASSVVINGLAPYNYLWSNAATTANAINLPAGMTYLTVIDQNGCTRVDSTIINPSPAVGIQFLPANAHCDSANGLINTIITNNTGWVHYLWNTSAVTNSINMLAPGSYWLQVTDSIGCISTDTIQIADDGVPHLHVVQYVAPVCKGDTNGVLVLDGISGVAPYKYSFDGVNFSATAIMNNFAAGTYTIYIRDANSCITDTILTFNEPNELVITSSTPDTLVCYNDSTGKIVLSVSSGVAPYSWNFNGQGWQSNSQFTGLGVGSYYIEVKDSNNCLGDVTIPVVGPFLPLQVKLDVTDIECYQENNGEIIASASGGWWPLTIKWNHTTSQNTFLDNLKAGLYTIKVTDEKGCSISKTDTIFQNYCCESYLPNSFTPNGDNNNDVFRAISPASDIESFSLKVFNRWGQEVFSTKEVKQGWDGRIDGVDACMDTYFYLMYYKCTHATESKMLKGDVLLLR